MISGHGTIETAVKATKLGAFDFLEKPLTIEKVTVVREERPRSSAALELEDTRLEGIASAQATESSARACPMKALRQQLG